jgi:glycosyltransferase involved in cell wall biosynthesis
MNKKRILIFYDYFTPAYKAGGPIRSIDNLVGLLSGHLEFYIFTTNQDHDGTVLPTVADQWVMYKDHARVFYASQARRTYQSVSSAFAEVQPELIYINGMYSLLCVVYPLWLAKRYGLPVVISPRGMLQKSSLSIKPAKKHFYLACLRLLLLRRNKVDWHVTNHQEMQDLKHYVPEANIICIGNVPHLVSEKARRKPNEANDQKRFLTVALISPMKNHALVLKSFQKLTTGVEYDIYGPVKDQEYWQNCQKEIERLPQHIIINYKGEISPLETDGIWADYDFYIQPSRSENFGHAIFEALSAGLPVIISDQTPWRHLEEKKAGWDVDLNDPQALGRAIERALKMSAHEYQEWSRAARKLAEDYVHQSDFIKDYKALFQHVGHK